MLLVGCIILGTGFRLYFVTICDVIDW
jgi:hypothetical protein